MAMCKANNIRSHATWIFTPASHSLPHAQSFLHHFIRMINYESNTVCIVQRHTLTRALIRANYFPILFLFLLHFPPVSIRPNHFNCCVALIFLIFCSVNTRFTDRLCACGWTHTEREIPFSDGWLAILKWLNVIFGIISVVRATSKNGTMPKGHLIWTEHRINAPEIPQKFIYLFPFANVKISHQINEHHVQRSILHAQFMDIIGYWFNIHAVANALDEVTATSQASLFSKFFFFECIIYHNSCKALCVVRQRSFVSAFVSYGLRVARAHTDSDEL